MEPKKNNKILIIIIVILSLLLVGVGGYFAYDKFVVGNHTNENQQEKIKYNDFSFANFNINLINRLDNINDIYAFDIKHNSDSDKANDIVAHYKDEKTVKLATVSQKLDYRILDINRNKVYFLILDNDRPNTNLFELYYIDLNNLDKGPISLSDFNKMYKKESKFCMTSGCTTYSTQIYVKNDLIYYTALNNGNSNIKAYNLKTKKTKTIISEEIYWYDYFVDKANSKIFYQANNGRNLYLTNLDGSNKMKLDNNINNDSNFWTGSYFKKSPIFAGKYNDDCSMDGCSYNLYKFDYSNKTFVEIKKQVKYFYAQVDEISLTKDEDIINTFYVVK
jgi:hypothetical protein